MGATLGDDTIRAGVFSVGLAFAAILLFMIVYYRFSGLVACVALLSNLLLTVGFMVAVQATFTLPGLAGLVLMLGMAVDANVLIYERLREERDRGASLALAIRNGYDRAFPTIIDTHLTSIFTAIVLYVVGNDQLKGFGVTLTVGLIISLFTSLYVTRLFFDLWLHKGWLKKLGMFRLLSKPSINFMAIRYYWFTATIVLTIAGVTVFLLRGEQGLNIDFVGGTAYGGELTTPMDLMEMRDLFSKGNQDKKLKVTSVKEVPGPTGSAAEEGHYFKVSFAENLGDRSQDDKAIYINKANGDTPEEREKDIASRAAQLPDWSIEMVYLSGDTKSDADPNKSSHFTIRTPEKEVHLVERMIDRLLKTEDANKWVSLLKKVDVSFTMSELKGSPTEAQQATLTFTDYASPSFATTLLDEVFDERFPHTKGEKRKYNFILTGEGDSKESRYKKMQVTLDSKMPRKQFDTLLTKFKAEFNARPQPERLENFDSALAAETQGRAIIAIVLSWGAILLYLWLRFGSWTFGAATVLCLIHDLFFTLGLIAFASMLHTTPVGQFLKFEDFKLDLTAVAALLTLVGYSVSDTIVVFDRIREVRGKNPDLTPQMINDSVNQTLSRTLLTAFSVFLVVIVLYIWGGPGVHLFAFVMVIGVIVGTYSSIYIASPLLLIFGEGKRQLARGQHRQITPVPAEA
jgi:SecD/SecF fusion protein